jgi:hypothetical protein
MGMAECLDPNHRQPVRRYSYPDTYADTDPHSYTDAYSNTYSDADSYAYPDTDTHADAYSNTYTNAYSDRQDVCRLFQHMEYQHL